MKNPDSMLHFFSGGEDKHFRIPDRFTFPFSYTPADITVAAAGLVMEHINGDSFLRKAFSEGKMLGVLVVKDNAGKTGFLAGFSGLAGGRNSIPYFVPPLTDLLDPQGHFKKTEAEIGRLNAKILSIENSREYILAMERIGKAKKEKELRISSMKAELARAKETRKEVRKTASAPEILEKLAMESRGWKASLKRLSALCDEEIVHAGKEAGRYAALLSALKTERKEMSEALQSWIFQNSIVCNALGESLSIEEVFSRKGLVPPGGTGECAAPKMLQYAYTHGMKPIAMGEFWFGKEISGRLHGSFYPACSGKCGPLLGFMLQGLDVEPNRMERQKAAFSEETGLLYEDESLIAVSKPAGMLSVPGISGGKSLLEILSENRGTLLEVHRLDMDTSGVILFAKDKRTQAELRKQFEERSAEKRYIALIEERTGGKALSPGMKGTISLPLSASENDRPRQKPDPQGGKEAITDYEVLSENKDGIRILFRPRTGRTHQLRVHSAAALGRPIKGDLLYGGSRDASMQRMFLHALNIKIRHPETRRPIVFESECDF